MNDVAGQRDLEHFVYYIIRPVRKVTQETEAKIETAKRAQYKLPFPPLHIIDPKYETDQEHDPIGTTTLATNTRHIGSSDVIIDYFDPLSQASDFDRAVTFALEKPLHILNRPDVEKAAADVSSEKHYIAEFLFSYEKYGPGTAERNLPWLHNWAIGMLSALHEGTQPVLLTYEHNSPLFIFHFGMAFALNKDIYIARPADLRQHVVEGTKSIENVLITLDARCRAEHPDIRDKQLGLNEKSYKPTKT